MSKLHVLRLAHVGAPLLALTALSHLPAAAQASTPAPVSSGGTILQSRYLFSPDLNSPVSSVATIFAIEGGTEDETAKLQLGWTRRRISFALTGKAPIEEGTGDTELTDWDELRPGTNVGLGMTGVYWANARATVKPPGQIAVEWCRQVQQESSAQDRGRLKNYPCGDVRRATLPRELVPSFDRAVAFVGRPIVWGLNLNGGPKEYTFIDRTVSTPQDEDHWQWSLGGGVGSWLPLGFVTAGVAYKTSYKEGDEANLCTPIEGSNASRCEAFRFGQPARKEGFVGRFEVRRFFSASAAINPRVSYDAAEDRWVAQVPLYLVPGKEGALIGGIVPGWTSEKGGITLGIFVGTSLGFSLAEP